MIRSIASARRLAPAVFIIIAGAWGDLAAKEPGAIPEDPLETLNQGQLQEAFRVLSRHYIEHESLTYERINKAALEGLMRRLSFGAELIPKGTVPEGDEIPLSYHTEIIPEGVVYIRPVTFDEEEVSRTAAELRKHAKSEEIDTLILDLRSPVPQFEFARAAAFADLFTGRNELLFKIKKPTDQKARLFLSKEDTLWKKRLIVLIDRETSSVAETVAAVLDYHGSCFFIGQKTTGRAVQYEQVSLNEDTLLRFASAEVLLPDDRRLFRNGVEPDLESVTPPKKKRRIFEASEENGLARYVFDKERPRMNEAALVAGTDPELEYYLAKHAGETTAFDKTPLQDRALQTALESLVAIDFIKVPAKEKAAEPKPDDSKAEPAPEPDDKPSADEEKNPVDAPADPKKKKKDPEPDDDAASPGEASAFYPYASFLPKNMTA